MKICHHDNGKACKHEDRLSSLPNAILIEILSLLPLNSAAITGVLSNRWKDLWTQITTIRIDEEYLSVTKDGVTFPFAFISGIMLKLTSPVINLLKIIVPCYSDDINIVLTTANKFYTPLNCWVRQFFDRRVKAFKMIFGRSSILCRMPGVAPIYQCQSLEVLHLHRWVFEDLVDQLCCLPNLKELNISSNVLEVNSLSALIRSSTLLETLTLHDLDLKVHEHSIVKHIIEISQQNLKRLHIKTAHRIEDMEFVIDAPKLEQIYLWDVNYYTRYYFVKRPTSLVDANVTRHQPQNPAKDILGAMPNVKYLTISGACFTDMVGSTIPIFSHLTHLNVTIFLKLHWKASMHFFRSLPNLHTLYLGIRFIHGQEDEDMNWVGLDPAPACLSTTIQKIDLASLDGDKLELEIIRYILRVASALKTFNYSVRPVTNPDRNYQLYKEVEFCEELFSFPRSSSTCKINFVGSHVNVSTKGLKVGALDSRTLCRT